MESITTCPVPDITPECAPAEPYFELAACPTIAIGDGGNELGMGKAMRR
jgi:hypothetical protein